MAGMRKGLVPAAFRNSTLDATIGRMLEMPRLPVPTAMRMPGFSLEERRANSVLTAAGISTGLDGGYFCRTVIMRGSCEVICGRNSLNVDSQKRSQSQACCSRTVAEIFSASWCKRGRKFETSGSNLQISSKSQVPMEKLRTG